MVIADTGYWIALSDRGDPYFDAAVELSRSLNVPLITTWPVLTEVCHILLARRGILATLQFLGNVLDGGCTLFEIRAEHHKRVTTLMKKYRELPMDLADASLVILAEHLGHGRILSTDQRDFKSYRWKERRPFENLLARA